MIVIKKMAESDISLIVDKCAKGHWPKPAQNFFRKRKCASHLTCYLRDKKAAYRDQKMGLC